MADEALTARREAQRKDDAAFIQKTVATGRASREKEEAGQVQAASQEQRKSEAQAAGARVTEVRTKQEAGVEQGRGVAM